MRIIKLCNAHQNTTPCSIKAKTGTKLGRLAIIFTSKLFNNLESFHIQPWCHLFILPALYSLNRRLKLKYVEACYNALQPSTRLFKL